jgi:60 kDa SS-A/Ro ribonucleoprotein
VKYQSRDGWSHRDLLRLASPRTADPARQAVYRWIVGAPPGERTVVRKEQRGKWTQTDTYAATGELPAVILAYVEAQTADEAGLVRLIRERGLPMECVPTERRTAAVYRALIPGAGLTWLLRNLGNLSKHGVLTKGAWDEVKAVTARLADAGALRRARVHPIAVLSALKTYRSGRGVRGGGEWEPVPDVVDALDSAFYLAFGAVEPAARRTVIGLDVSGSMASGEVAGVPGLTPRVGAAAMCMVTYRTEPACEVVAFQDRIMRLDLSRQQTLGEVVRRTDGLPFGRTDCAQPMLWALAHGVQADTFVIYTDNETWAGNIHPAQALRQYRERTGIAARLVVVGMTSGGFTIADPADAGMLDVVGFDAAAPGVIADFSAGRL